MLYAWFIFYQKIENGFFLSESGLSFCKMYVLCLFEMVNEFKFS